jgi:hypothetical protein
MTILTNGPGIGVSSVIRLRALLIDKEAQFPLQRMVAIWIKLF